MTARITSGQIRRIEQFAAAACRNLTKDEAQHLIGHKEFQPRLGQLVRELTTTYVHFYRDTPTIERRFKLTLDYSVMPADALRATKCGRIYDWMLTHHPKWKSEGKFEVEACLIDMGSNYYIDESRVAIDKLGLVAPPDNMALWTLSRVHPYREIGIMDPGTIWRYDEDKRYVAFVDGYSDGREVWIRSTSREWNRGILVLALSK